MASGAPEGSTSTRPPLGASTLVASTIGSGQQCSNDDSIEWAIAVLRAYDDAVQTAVSSVRPSVRFCDFGIPAPFFRLPCLYV